VALAELPTEINLNLANTGIVLDDPSTRKTTSARNAPRSGWLQYLVLLGIRIYA
jgi:hypothetical protein